MVAAHLSVVTRDPPAQDVSKAGWPGLVGQYRLLTNGWTFTVELRDGELYGGRDPKKLRRLIPLTPDAFVLSGSLGEWLFVVENGQGARIVNLRKFAVLVWNRVAAGMPPAPTDRAAAMVRGRDDRRARGLGPHPSLGDQARFRSRSAPGTATNTYAADGSNARLG
jgi:hypothetical protein